MHQLVEYIVKHYYGITPKEIKPLGGGFYGRVFFVELFKEPYNIVIKIYLYPHLAEKESSQLKILSAHSIIKMPEVYFLHIANDTIPNDAIVMEYIPGVNAGYTNISLKETVKKNIAEAIIDNLLSYHKTKNPQGFGEIGNDVFESQWKDCYKPKFISALRKAENFHRDGKIDNCILSLLRKAYEKYDEIFYLPVEEACLIHGDYNTWNILLNEELTHVEAVIDPFNCCWADSELDLYQLLNANGKSFGLLDIYAAKRQLSENYALKHPFYMLVSEINHFYDAQVDMNVDWCMIPYAAQELEKQMKYYGLL